MMNWQEDAEVIPAAPTRCTGDADRSSLHPLLVAVFAAASGLAVANIYFAQPLISLIAPELGLHARLAGVIVSLTQLGYGAGLLFIVPLSDRFENRRLIIIALSGVVVGLMGIALSNSALTFLTASFLVGIGAVATQILVPFASHLAPRESRGKVVGTVMGGLLAGVMLARPFSSYIAAELGWRAVFFISASVMFLLIIVLLQLLPQRKPAIAMNYGSILRSLPQLIARTPALRRRAFYQGMLFAAFNVFWTGSPLLLVHEFGMGHRGIALFTLAGAAGVLAAPIAGRLADRGFTSGATGFALAATVLALALSRYAEHLHSLALLTTAAIVLDAAVQINQVLSLRAIYMLAPDLRGRLNGLYMTFVFVCGAMGSMLSAAVYDSDGWATLAAVATLFGVAALTLYATEFGDIALRPKQPKV